MANPIAYYYCTGPIYVFISTNGLASSAQFLGTCEQYPTEQEEHAWTPVWNDLGGPVVPSERQFHGKTKFMSLDLNRFKQTVMDQVLATPRQGTDGNPAGTNSVLDRGAYLIENGCGYSMWLIFSFYGTQNAVGYPDLPPGEYYPYVMTVGNYDDRQGTQNKKVRLVTEAQEFRTSNGGQFLYSTDIADMGGLNSIIPV